MNDLTLSTPIPELTEKLLSESDPDNVQAIINMFNAHTLKQNAIRSATINQLQDKVISQMEARLDKHADEFNNKDLLEYYKALQNSLGIDMKMDDTPSIKVNSQVNVNINNVEFNRESRKKITDAVNSILEKYKEEAIDVEFNEREVQKES